VDGGKEHIDGEHINFYGSAKDNMHKSSSLSYKEDNNDYWVDND